MRLGFGYRGFDDKAVEGAASLVLFKGAGFDVRLTKRLGQSAGVSVVTQASVPAPSSITDWSLYFTEMPTEDFLILPTTKVAALLDRYPELEDVLIELAPPFKKLKNPFLRRGVARVASLKQAAAVAGLPVEKLINTLRTAVGQAPITFGEADEQAAYFSAQPDWFDAAGIVHSIDESATDPNKMPIAELLQHAMRLNSGEILELVTHYLPAPGIDIMKSKGYRVWSSHSAPEVIRTFVCKP